MVQSSASSASALPRFLLSLSASSTSSQQLHGPANEADACPRIAPASPDSACRSTSQDIELVALHPWNSPSRILKHKRASLSLPAVSLPSALPERKSASASPGKPLVDQLASRRSSASLELSAASTTDSPKRGMTPIERQNKANQVWRGCW
ncbi:hypothetical protein J3F84DRAFT_352141 [Trichoderma pleuroticola]